MTLSPPSTPRDPGTPQGETPGAGTWTGRTVRARIDARTLRHDRWWLQPAITVAVLLARRDALGVDEVVVGAELAEVFAPVLRRLRAG